MGSESEKKKISSDPESSNNGVWSVYVLVQKTVNAVKHIGVSTYGIGSKAAVIIKDNGSQMARGTVNLGAKAVNAVKENGPDMVKPYIPGPQWVEQMSSYVTHPATQEMAKYFVPGVTPALGIARALLKDKTATKANSTEHDKQSELLVKELKLMQAENERLKAELKHTKSINAKQALPMTPEEVVIDFVATGMDMKGLVPTLVVPVRGKVCLDDQSDGKMKVTLKSAI